MGVTKRRVKKASQLLLISHCCKIQTEEFEAVSKEVDGRWPCNTVPSNWLGSTILSLLLKEGQSMKPLFAHTVCVSKQYLEHQEGLCKGEP